MDKIIQEFADNKKIHRNKSSQGSICYDFGKILIDVHKSHIKEILKVHKLKLELYDELRKLEIQKELDNKCRKEQKEKAERHILYKKEYAIKQQQNLFKVRFI
jgi:hypothetical protein